MTHRPARTSLFRRLRSAWPMATSIAIALSLTACASGPTGPEVAPSDSTVQLGRIVSQTFLTQVNEEAQSSGGGVGVGLGAIGGFGGGGGAGVGLGFDLGRLFSGSQPTRQIDIYAFKVKTLDGPEVTVNSPAVAGLENGACVRVISANRPGFPRMAPSRECP